MLTQFTDVYMWHKGRWVNTLEPWKKWLPFCRVHLQMYFIGWNHCILIQILLDFVLKGPLDNMSSLIHWYWPGKDAITWRCLWCNKVLLGHNELKNNGKYGYIIPIPIFHMAASNCPLRQQQSMTNSPGKCGSNLKSITFKLISHMDILSTSHETDSTLLQVMPQDHIHDRSTLGQVMAWCCLTTSHYEPMLTQISLIIWWHWATVS